MPKSLFSVASRTPAAFAGLATMACGLFMFAAPVSAADGLFSDQRLGRPMDQRIDSSTRQQQDQPIDSNAEVGTSLLGTTLDSTIVDPRANTNERVWEQPPRERGVIAEERSGRVDDPERSQPITR